MLNPLRCYECQVFGHHENKCNRQAIRVNCGEPEHCPSGSCQRPAKCVNCSGDHPSSSKVCPSWEKEKKIVKIKVEQNITFPEARKQYEQLFYEAKSYASAVRPSTCNKATQTEDKSTQTDENITNYTKQTKANSYLIFHENHEKPYHIFISKIGVDVAKCVVCCIRDWRVKLRYRPFMPRTVCGR